MNEFLANAWTEVSSSQLFFSMLDIGTQLFKIIFTIIVIFVIKRIVVRLIKNYFDHSKRFHIKITRRNTLKQLSLNLVQYIFYFVLIYTILSFLGIPVGTLVAGAGVIGLAVSFGAKDLIADLVNGFFILLENQYDVGDEVIFNHEVEGQVIDLGIRTTTIRSYDGTTNYLANGEIKLVSNLSQHAYRVPFQFLVYPDTDLDQLGQVIEGAFSRAKNQDERVSHIQNFGVMHDDQGRLVYEVRMWMYNHSNVLYIQGEYYRIFFKAIKDAGIVLPSGSVTTVGYKDLASEN